MQRISDTKNKVRIIVSYIFSANLAFIYIYFIYQFINIKFIQAYSEIWGNSFFLFLGYKIYNISFKNFMLLLGYMILLCVLHYNSLYDYEKEDTWYW